MFRFILFIFVGFCSSYFFRNSTVCPPKQGGQRERCQVERLCQGWLLFNELLLKGRRVPNFFQDELACGIARFMTRARELIPLPLVSSLWLVWQQLFTDLSLSFSRVLWSNSAPPGRRSDKFSSCPRALVQLPGCSKPFYGTHRKSIFMRAMIAISSLDTPG